MKHCFLTIKQDRNTWFPGNMYFIVSVCNTLQRWPKQKNIYKYLVTYKVTYNIDIVYCHNIHISFNDFEGSCIKQSLHLPEGISLMTGKWGNIKGTGVFLDSDFLLKPALICYFIKYECNIYHRSPKRVYLIFFKHTIFTKQNL